MQITPGRIRRITAALAGFIYPPHCLLCRRYLGDDPGLCAPCWREVGPIEGPVCVRCGAPFPHGGANVPDCGNCRDKAFAFSRLITLAAFGDPVQRLVHDLKYRGRTAPARILGTALAQRLLRELPDAGGCTVAPVPLHSSRERERGYNQSELLARTICRVTGGRMAPKALCRLRPTTTQTRLSRPERARNVEGAFRARHPERLAGARVILVDDVVTTGATASACARAALSAGAAEVVVAAIASPYGAASVDALEVPV